MTACTGSGPGVGRIGVVALSLVLLAGACQRGGSDAAPDSPAPDATPQPASTQAPASAPAPAAAESSAIAPPPAVVAPPPAVAAPPTTAPPPIVQPPRADVVAPTLSLADVLDVARPLAGDVVSVVGRCLGYGVVRVAGPPPRTRSDWQLEADGLAIWVTGPRPAGCSPTHGAPAPGRIVARVAQDTVAARGGGSATVRRFLEVSAAP